MSYIPLCIINFLYFGINIIVDNSFLHIFVIKFLLYCPKKLSKLQNLGIPPTQLFYYCLINMETRIFNLAYKQYSAVLNCWWLDARVLEHMFWANKNRSNIYSLVLLSSPSANRQLSSQTHRFGCILVPIEVKCQDRLCLHAYISPLDRYSFGHFRSRT